MYPHERSLVKRMEKMPFVLVGVNSDPKTDIQAAMKREQITWPFFWDGGNTNGPIAKKYGVQSWPTIYVLDAKGVIRYKNVRGPKMDEAVETLLKEMGQTPPPKEAEGG
jgi:peroxiredoxin